MTYANLNYQTKSNRTRHNINRAQQISNGTATINLKPNLSKEKREHIVCALLKESRINSIYFSSRKPQILNLDFNYDEVQFHDLENLLVKNCPEATIMSD